MPEIELMKYNSPKSPFGPHSEIKFWHSHIKDTVEATWNYYIWMFHRFIAYELWDIYKV